MVREEMLFSLFVTTFLVVGIIEIVAGNEVEDKIKPGPEPNKYWKSAHPKDIFQLQIFSNSDISDQLWRIQEVESIHDFLLTTQNTIYEIASIENVTEVEYSLPDFWRLCIYYSRQPPHPSIIRTHPFSDDDWFPYRDFDVEEDGNYTIYWEEFAPCIIGKPEMQYEDHKNMSEICDGFDGTTVDLKDIEYQLVCNNQTIYVGENKSLEIKNQNPGTYYYHIKSTTRNYTDSIIGSSWSNVLKVTVLRVPPPPTIHQISDDGDDNYLISWSIVPFAENYTLLESCNATTSNLNATWKTIYIGKNVSFEVTNRKNGIYYYQVKATNSLGSSWSNIESVRVLTTEGVLAIDLGVMLFVITLIIILFLFFSIFIIIKRRGEK